MSGLGSAIDELAVADLTGVPVSVVGDELVELLALRARLDAQITRRVGHVDRQGIAQTQACASTSTWLVGVARLGRGEAVGQVRAARALHRGDLPTTAAAYGDGRISLAQVRAIEATADGLDPQLVAEAEPTLVAAAERLDPGRLRVVCERFRATVDAARHAKDRAVAMRRGRCSLPAPSAAWSPSRAC